MLVEKKVVIVGNETLTILALIGTIIVPMAIANNILHFFSKKFKTLSPEHEIGVYLTLFYIISC